MMRSTPWPLFSKTGCTLENVCFPGDLGLYKNPIKFNNYPWSEVEPYGSKEQKPGPVSVSCEPKEEACRPGNAYVAFWLEVWWGISCLWSVALMSSGGHLKFKFKRAQTESIIAHLIFSSPFCKQMVAMAPTSLFDSVLDPSHFIYPFLCILFN